MLHAERSTKQYLVFHGVTKKTRDQIDRLRHSIGKHIRATHYADRDLLILKLRLSIRHQVPHLTLIQWYLTTALYRMGVPRYELVPVGGATFYAPTSSSSKEDDESYMPRS